MSDYCNTKLAGLATAENHKDWSCRARGNSYHSDKAQLRHDLSGEGAAADQKAVPEFPVGQRNTEGQGRARINVAARPNTFTGSTS